MLQEKSMQQQDNQPQNLSPIDYLSQRLDADFFLFSGPINRSGAKLLIEKVEIAAVSNRKNATLILTTYGGDPDAAFIIARTLQTSYEKFDLYLFGPCKSAGTLLALGAKQIIMSHRAELGPLDVQLLKDDELIRSSSGLEIFMALSSLNKDSFRIWQTHFLSIIELSSGSITTKTAADIATSITVGLLSPITAQIDPLKLGEMQRAIEIAFEYGIRLGADPSNIKQLIHDYPSHSFVIDFEEASMLFPDVRRPTLVEIELERTLQKSFHKDYQTECIREPYPQGVVAYLNKQQEEHHDLQTSRLSREEIEWPDNSGEDETNGQLDNDH